MLNESGSPNDRSLEDRRAENFRALNIVPDDAGPRASGFRGGIVHSTRQPGSQVFFSGSHFAAVMLAPSTGMEAAIASDNVQRFDAPTGMLVINPANVESRVSWRSTRENAVVAIGPESLYELAEQEFDRTDIEFQIPAFSTVDLTALKIAELMKSSLAQQAPVSELYVDSLVTIFGIHLLRNYTDMRAPSARIAGGLSVIAARRVEEFLRENFARKLAVADLAAICELSPGHFIQAFTRTFGMSPHRYLVKLRLERAEKMLVDTEMTIAAVAYLTGFSSQSHLTSTMRKGKGLTPAQLRSRRL